jgi:HSP20 family protein
MLAVRREPFTNLWNEMDRMFRRFGTEEPAWPAPAFTYPPVNLWEDEKNVYVEAELPGLELEKLELLVSEGNELTIKGERLPPKVEKVVWHRQECLSGKFARVVPLPVLVAPDKVEARFEKGILFVTLPKAEAALPRRIPVKKE